MHKSALVDKHVSEKINTGLQTQELSKLRKYSNMIKGIVGFKYSAQDITTVTRAFIYNY